VTVGEPLAIFDMDGPGGQIVLRMSGFADLELGHRGDLLGARRNVDFVLDRFRSLLGGERPGLGNLTSALNYLDGELAQIAFHLVDDDAALLEKIRSRLARRWPRWRNTDDVPIVEVRGHHEYFPFELLPLLDTTPFPTFANIAEVGAGLRRFLGFSTAVRRVGPQIVETAPLVASHSLPVQLITYDMAGVKAEAAAFGLRTGQMSVDGPWPVHGQDSAEVEQRLLDALYDPGRSLSGEPGSGPAQIQHFACHCLTGNQTDSGFTLLIGGPGHEHRIALGAIRLGYRGRGQSLGPADGPRSLIVANACGSAKVDPESRRSFPRYFLRNRHRGFVGTETDVPDTVAAVFAEEFYGALLDGTPLGTAVVHARRRLFARWHNPLGLLYVCYGDPTLAVEQA
jgi:hypothetical protein